MKPASSALLTYLSTQKQLKFSDGYTITTLDGDVLRFCTTQSNFTAVPPDEMNPVTFESKKILISGLKYRCGVGLDVDEQEITILIKDPTVSIQGQPFGTALRVGLLDGARIKRDRFFFNEWNQAPVGGVTFFSGVLSIVDAIGYMEIGAKVKSDLVLLNVPCPRNVFQTGCIHTLYDGGCGLDPADFSVQGMAGAGSTSRVINWASATAGEYDLGTVRFESGPNVGLTRTVRRSTGSALVVTFPFEFTPNENDDFVAFPGCNKTDTRCETLQSSVAQDFRTHFRGFPFVPPPETAY